MTKEKDLIKRTPDSTSVAHFASDPDAFIHLLEQADKIAEYVATSNTFGQAFKNDKGEISKSDIVAAILLGNDLGIPPMAAITLGKRLNADAYFKVMKGKSLGLDPVSALSSIAVIPTQAGMTVHTGVHVITKVLLDAKVQFEITEDFLPVYGYINVSTKAEVDYERYKDRIYLVDKETSQEEVTKAKQEKKIIAFKKLVNRRTTIVFNRPGFKEVKITYTLQDAIDAGLHRGKSSEGEEVEGKANWNNHPATMLRNRALTIGGRIICGDKLQNVYSSEEASEFTSYTLEDENIQDVKNYNAEDAEEVKD